MLENNTNILGSQPENYIRNLLNCTLPLHFPNVEIIVGLNNKSILDNGKEIDIPILIVNGDTILKIGVEYDGYFWHKDIERDFNKMIDITEKGYKVFSIVEDSNNMSENKLNMKFDELINEIVKYIKESITI